jgi:hypothetical protein
MLYETHETKANVIGMYSLSDDWMEKSDVIVVTYLGKCIELTFKLTLNKDTIRHCEECEELESESDYYEFHHDSKYISSLEITFSNDENKTIENITHWTKGNYEIDMISISKFLYPYIHSSILFGSNVDKYGNSYDSYYSCNVFNITFIHDKYKINGNYRINKNLFILKYHVINERKKFINAISEELISKVYSPERFSSWIHLDSDNIEIFRFLQLFQIIPKFNL